MFVFTKYRDPENRYDVSNVEVVIESNEVYLPTLFSEFVRFLNASGYVITDGTTIHIEDGECFIEHPPVNNGCGCNCSCQTNNSDVTSYNFNDASMECSCGDE